MYVDMDLEKNTINAKAYFIEINLLIKDMKTDIIL